MITKSITIRRKETDYVCTRIRHLEVSEPNAEVQSILKNPKEYHLKVNDAYCNIDEDDVWALDGWVNIMRGAKNEYSKLQK